MPWPCFVSRTNERKTSPRPAMKSRHIIPRSDHKAIGLLDGPEKAAEMRVRRPSHCRFFEGWPREGHDIVGFWKEKAPRPPRTVCFMKLFRYPAKGMAPLGVLVAFWGMAKPTDDLV